MVNKKKSNGYKKYKPEQNDLLNLIQQELEEVEEAIKDGNRRLKALREIKTNLQIKKSVQIQQAELDSRGWPYLKMGDKLLIGDGDSILSNHWKPMSVKVSIQPKVGDECEFSYCQLSETHEYVLIVFKDYYGSSISYVEAQAMRKRYLEMHPEEA